MGLLQRRTEGFASRSRLKTPQASRGGGGQGTEPGQGLATGWQHRDGTGPGPAPGALGRDRINDFDHGSRSQQQAQRLASDAPQASPEDLELAAGLALVHLELHNHRGSPLVVAVGPGRQLRARRCRCTDQQHKY